MPWLCIVQRDALSCDKEKLKEALKCVIQEFIRDNKLREFLLKHGDEVIEMATLDYTFERREKLIWKDGFNDGFKDGENQGYNKGISQGEIKGKLDSLIELIKDNSISVAKAAEKMSISEQEFIKLYM